MKIGRRELTAAWVTIGVLWVLIRPFGLPPRQAYETLSATLLCWGTAALAGVSLYCFLKWREQTPIVGRDYRRLLVGFVLIASVLIAVGFSIWTAKGYLASRRALAEIERGDRYAEDHDDETAIACYSKAIELQPTAAQAYIKRAKASNLKEMFGEAPHSVLGDLTRAVELEPSNAECYYERGVYYYSHIQIKKGIADFTEAIRLNPNFAAAYRYRADMFLSNGDSTLAVADATKAITLDPNDEMNWYYRSMLYERMGNLDEALKNASKAVEVKPIRDTVWQRAKVEALLGMNKEAIDDYTRIIKSNPESAHYLTARAAVWRKLNESAKAESDEQLAKEMKEKSDAHYEKIKNYSREMRDAESKNEALSKNKK